MCTECTGCGLDSLETGDSVGAECSECSECIECGLDSLDIEDAMGSGVWELKGRDELWCGAWAETVLARPSKASLTEIFMAAG